MRPARRLSTLAGIRSLNCIQICSFPKVPPSATSWANSARNPTFGATVPAAMSSISSISTLLVEDSRALVTGSSSCALRYCMIPITETGGLFSSQGYLPSSSGSRNPRCLNSIPNSFSRGNPAWQSLHLRPCSRENDGTAEARRADKRTRATSTTSISTAVMGMNDFFIATPLPAVYLPDGAKVRRYAITCQRCSSVSLSLYDGIVVPAFFSEIRQNQCASECFLLTAGSERSGAPFPSLVGLPSLP